MVVRMVVRRVFCLELTTIDIALDPISKKFVRKIVLPVSGLGFMYSFKKVFLRQKGRKQTHMLALYMHRQGVFSWELAMKTIGRRVWARHG